MAQPSGSKWRWIILTLVGLGLALLLLVAITSSPERQQRLDQSFGDDVVTRSVDENGTGLLFGVGAGVTLAKAFHLRLELQSVDIDEDGSGQIEYDEFMSLLSSSD